MLVLLRHHNRKWISDWKAIRQVADTSRSYTKLTYNNIVTTKAKKWFVIRIIRYKSNRCEVIAGSKRKLTTALRSVIGEKIGVAAKVLKSAHIFKLNINWFKDENNNNKKGGNCLRYEQIYLNVIVNTSSSEILVIRIFQIEIAEVKLNLISGRSFNHPCDVEVVRIILAKTGSFKHSIFTIQLNHFSRKSRMEQKVTSDEKNRESTNNWRISTYKIYLYFTANGNRKKL